MKTFRLLFYFLAISKVASNHDRRIIDGKEVEIDQAPFVVSIKMTSQMDGLIFHCGGAIIGPREILTAAHCVYDKLYPPYAYTFFIRAGSSYYHKEGIRRRVDLIWVHPLYHPHEVNFDFAFLRLDLPFQFSWNLKPIELGITEPPNGKLVTVYGWGETNPVWSQDNKLAKKLNAVNITVWHRDSCRRFPAFQAHEHDIYDVVMCVKNENSTNKIPCRGDSGGPFVYKGALVGVLSGSLTVKGTHYFNTDEVSCIDPTSVGVYSSVINQRDWILGLLHMSQFLP